MPPRKRTKKGDRSGLSPRARAILDHVATARTQTREPSGLDAPASSPPYVFENPLYVDHRPRVTKEPAFIPHRDDPPPRLPINEPYSADMLQDPVDTEDRVHLVVPDALYERVALAAFLEHVSMSDIVEEAFKKLPPTPKCKCCQEKCSRIELTPRGRIRCGCTAKMLTASVPMANPLTNS